MPDKKNERPDKSDTIVGDEACQTVQDFASQRDISAYNDGVQLADALIEEFNEELRKARAKR
jgi:hypothetical protein